MSILDFIGSNLFTPAPLFFILGIFAGLLKSDLEIPDSISRYLSIYLMMAIGFKGGVSINGCNYLNFAILYAILAGLLVSFLQPFLGYFLLRRTTELSEVNAAAVAAHYGSISLATFAAATSFA